MVNESDIGLYGFERINRTQLQMWAEAVSDDEALGVDEKAFALKLVGEFSDSDDGEHVAEDFGESMTAEESIRWVSMERLIDSGHLRIRWTRKAGDRTIFGLVLGQEIWTPGNGEAA